MSKQTIWNGAWTTVIADVTTGWNNVSISSYLTDATFEIRFVDTNNTSDSANGAWEIEGVLLHVWTDAAPNYRLDQEVQWTSLDYDNTYEYLCE